MPVAPKVVDMLAPLLTLGALPPLTLTVFCLESRSVNDELMLALARTDILFFSYPVVVEHALFVTMI